MKNPYLLSDKAISILQRRAVRRFTKAKSKAALLKFDELYVINLLKNLYEDLAKDNEQLFLELAQKQYRAAEPQAEELPTKKWLSALLLAYDPITLYVYQHEIDRKRDRAMEAINSSPKKAQEFKKALKYWAQMTAQYADEISDKASLKAWKDIGTKRVQWHTEEDDRVCEYCAPLDGKTFDIDKVPPKQHWGCRCWLTPVKED